MDSTSLTDGRHSRVFVVAMVLSVAAHAAALALVTLPVTPGEDSATEATHEAEPARDWTRQERPMRVVDLRARSAAETGAGAPAPSFPSEPLGLDRAGESVQLAATTVPAHVRPVMTSRAVPRRLLASDSRLESRMDRAVQAFRQRMDERDGRRTLGRDDPRVRIRGGYGRGGAGGPGCSTPPIARGTDRGIGSYFSGR